MTDRPSLTDGVLDDVWSRARVRLERYGVDRRGRLSVPHLTSEARRRLAALIGRPPRSTVDLAALERGLVALGVGDDLPDALAVLGHPVSSEPAERRAARLAAREARELARDAVSQWPEEWAPAWIEEVIRSGGLSDPELVTRVRTILDAVADGDPVSRVDLAARLFGDAHALDTGTRLEAATARALRHRLGPDPPAEVWTQAGVTLDLVSAPVLTWNLPGELGQRATELGFPLHLSQLALRTCPVTAPANADVLVVENPRVVEAAAQMRSPLTVVSTNGNPSGAVRLLLDQLLAAGCNVRYHGDFDAAGLAISRPDGSPRPASVADGRERLPRSARRRCRGRRRAPRRRAPSTADAVGSRVAVVFDEHRRIVHEERLLPGLLTTPADGRMMD